MKTSSSVRSSDNALNNFSYVIKLQFSEPRMSSAKVWLQQFALFAEPFSWCMSTIDTGFIATNKKRLHRCLRFIPKPFLQDSNRIASSFTAGPENLSTITLILAHEISLKPKQNGDSFFSGGSDYLSLH